MVQFLLKIPLSITPLLFILICTCNSRFDRLREAMSEHKTKWQQQAIATYSYRFGRYCSCQARYAGPFRIFVVDNRVDSIYSYVEKRPINDTLNEFCAIDGLFDILNREIDRGPPDIYAEFDPGYHFPALVRIDNIETAAGDETGFDVDSFVVR